jgi:site-specific DNA-cytosine methylase
MGMEQALEVWHEGQTAAWKRRCAKGFGSPQERERLHAIGHRSFTFELNVSAWHFDRYMVEQDATLKGLRESTAELRKTADSLVAQLGGAQREHPEEVLRPTSGEAP